MKSIIVIGGGAAGMIAAISAKTTNPSCKVILLEKNEKLGKKIYITGKGRCNVTNAAPMDEYLNYYVSALFICFPYQLISLTTFLLLDMAVPQLPECLLSA